MTHVSLTAKESVSKPKFVLPSQQVNTPAFLGAKGGLSGDSMKKHQNGNGMEHCQAKWSKHCNIKMPKAWSDTKTKKKSKGIMDQTQRSGRSFQEPRMGSRQSHGWTVRWKLNSWCWICIDMVCHYVSIIVEGSLEVKLPTIWTDEKQRWEESEKRREEERESLRRKEDPGTRKRVRKVAIHTVFFQWFVAPEGRKVDSLKRRVRSLSQLARWEMKNCTPLWREAHFQVKMYIAPQLRSTFRSCDVEKVHAVVARSTFRSQHVKKHQGFGPFLEVQMSFRVAGAKGLCTLSKVSKNVGVL